MSHRDKAVELLRHYFALAMKPRELTSDNFAEIEQIVDELMIATVVTIRAAIAPEGHR